MNIECNGYTNYETYTVMLYLDNEYNHYQAMQSKIKSPAYRHNVKALAKSIAVYVRGFRLLSQRKLARVNWTEIAQDYIYELDLQSMQVTESQTWRSIYLSVADFDYQLDNFVDTNTYSAE